MSFIFKHIFRIVENNNLNSRFNNIEYSDTKPFVPDIKYGKVIKVYDGDTITIASKMPYKKSPVYRFSVRLNRIDCPEIKGKNDNEKECAKLAKKEIEEMIMGKIVRLENVKMEKYGRLLAEVYYNNINLSEHLLEKRLAVTYDGGTKMVIDNWMEYYNHGIVKNL
jgi:micrococcal nuclease